MIRAPPAIASDTSAQISSIRSAIAAPPPSTAYRPRETWVMKPGMSPSRLMCRILARSSLEMTGNGSTTWRQDAGRRLEQVRLRADGAAERGDELLADGVQRRVGDLREQLAEVVEQQPWLVAERRDRGVGAHRADRLGAGVRHRGQQDPQLLLGVAEDLLAAGDRRVGVHDVLALGDVVEVDLAGVQPLAVRVLGGELGLDLLVLDDPVLLGVDEEHPARLEPALADDARRVEVEHADLGREHDQAVVGDPVAAGAQAVAVEHRADLGAVGEHDARGAVPRLHQRGVELVERRGASRPSRRGSPTPPGSSSAPSAAASGRPCAAARAPRRRWRSRRRRWCRSGRSGRGRRGSGRRTAAPRGPASSCGCP